MSIEHKKFAWLPRRVTSGERVWLQNYYEHWSAYDPSTGKPPAIGFYFVWTETKEERLWRLIKG